MIVLSRHTDTCSGKLGGGGGGGGTQQKFSVSNTLVTA